MAFERKHIPNQLTMLRLVFAAAFFGVLQLYRYGEQHESPLWVLPVATALFILAAITDALDGYLARRWDVVSKFGRIMDPFCDKILILGAVIYLGSPRFLDPMAVEAGSFRTMVSGVYPWMVVLVLARELLVTGIRGEVEKAGIDFSATWTGKLKMILQSVVVPIVLVIVMIDPNREGYTWLGWVRDVLVYATVITTVLSGVPYITDGIQAFKKLKAEPEKSE
ncbi:CDP-alcohol phosphatidyltransferase family protein [Algisphaera agarilytica]|uniref:CDP-diacylglycerol--glycerol-3-phosphate 3-phosphatidyltransferase n=1 Tax=Algisphaera agarilytica TaxID=1385975 RepID=A0A7X0H7W6_9BACT|nr:CDP-alcohol phosphatidyltransferase family protein [Algisphaera agarilytica]MBB6430917.1 CDP-diacylglycerol--glycerol-3-phosphate 3-phosphatidyltransferase [Algisphaera agarilytica]